MLVCVLIDGETVVAAVEVVAIDVDDVVVDSDVVEMLEIADLAEVLEIFFLALLDCIEWTKYEHSVLGLTELMHGVITHGKGQIGLYLGVRHCLGCLIDGGICLGRRETGCRFQCLQSSCRIMYDLSSYERKWEGRQRTILLPRKALPRNSL